MVTWTPELYLSSCLLHMLSLFLCLNVRPLCTVIILPLCHMLDPAVSSLVYGLVYVTYLLRAANQSQTMTYRQTSLRKRVVLPINYSAKLEQSKVSVVFVLHHIQVSFSFCTLDNVLYIIIIILHSYQVRVSFRGGQRGAFSPLGS